MFSFTILIVFLEILIAVIILEISSSIITISAASIAASKPFLPIAIPISARISEGASFIPSPTKAIKLFGVLFFKAFSIFSTLSVGNILAVYSSTFNVVATLFAIFSLSPVSIEIFDTLQEFFSFLIVFFVFSFISSAITMYPAKLLSIATYTRVPISFAAVYEMFKSFISSSLPA